MGSNSGNGDRTKPHQTTTNNQKVIDLASSSPLSTTPMASSTNQFRGSHDKLKESDDHRSKGQTQRRSSRRQNQHDRGHSEQLALSGAKTPGLPPPDNIVVELPPGKPQEQDTNIRAIGKFLKGMVGGGSSDGQQQQPNNADGTGIVVKGTAHQQFCVTNFGEEAFVKLQAHFDKREKNSHDLIKSLNNENNLKDKELAFQRRVLAFRERELEEIEEKLNQDDQQYKRALVKWKHTVDLREREIEELRVANEDLTRNLEKCKDQIFSSQPMQSMADTQLRDAYTDLCSGIDYWVENNFGDEEDLIVKLRTADYTGNMPMQPNVVKLYLLDEDLPALTESAALQAILLQALISRRLFDRLFAPRRIFPGLHLDTEYWMDAIVNGMTRLRPAKDQQAIEMWRVDLVRTLNILDPAKDAQKAEILSIAASMIRCLGDLRTMECQGGADQNQCHQIVSEAAALANNVGQSMERYAFEFDFMPKDEPEKAVLKIEDLRKYKIIDSRNGMALRSSALPVAGPDGRVGKALFVVFPAFVRNSTKSGQKLVLAKSTIVVKFDQPVPSRGKKSKS